MDETTVLQNLIELHRDVELDCGKDPGRVSADVQPLDDLSGFDSPLIPTLVRLLAKKMGVVIPKGTRLKNPYISADRMSKLPLRDVARRFCELYTKKEKEDYESTRVKAKDNRGANSGGAANVGAFPGSGREDAKPAAPIGERDGSRKSRSIGGGAF